MDHYTPTITAFALRGFTRLCVSLMTGGLTTGKSWSNANTRGPQRLKWCWGTSLPDVNSECNVDKLHDYLIPLASEMSFKRFDQTTSLVTEMLLKLLIWTSPSTKMSVNFPTIRRQVLLHCRLNFFISVSHSRLKSRLKYLTARCHLRPWSR